MQHQEWSPCGFFLPLICDFMLSFLKQTAPHGNKINRPLQNITLKLDDAWCAEHDLSVYLDILTTISLLVYYYMYIYSFIVKTSSHFILLKFDWILSSFID